jgi:hypothetical protein
MSLARFAFQACSIDHSDISPLDLLRSLGAGRFRINGFRAVWNSVAQNPPSNPNAPQCRLHSGLADASKANNQGIVSDVLISRRSCGSYQRSCQHQRASFFGRWRSQSTWERRGRGFSIPSGLFRERRGRRFSGHDRFPKKNQRPRYRGRPRPASSRPGFPYPATRCVQEAEDGTARMLLQTLTLPSEDADILK